MASFDKLFGGLLIGYPVSTRSLKDLRQGRHLMEPRDKKFIPLFHCTYQWSDMRIKYGSFNQAKFGLTMFSFSTFRLENYEMNNIF